MRRPLLSLVILLFVPAHAQHEGHEHHHDQPVEKPGLFQSEMAMMTGMTPRDPTASMAMPGWSWMDMGVARLIFNDQGGPSGATVGESNNWNMVMGHHVLGPGRLTLMMMNSLEPATLHHDGSPQLFQTGESIDGRPNVDRQHPHDLFMNLSATWRLPFGENAGIWAQLAPVGEPALGPTAFMHRASSGENPSAPLSHHWQDSTHITYNVVTVGGGRGSFAVEASAFHGEEPDENRWGIDGGDIDSWSARVTFRSKGPWSAQFSYGDIENPEALEPGDVKRTTASVSYGARGNGPFAASFIWGHNDEEHGTSDGFLLEGAWAITTLDQLYARLEHVEKNEELLRTKQLGDDETTAAIRALTVGYLRDFPVWGKLATGVGGDLTFYDEPASLDPAYGNSPASGHVFLRLRWHAGNAHMHS